MAQWLRLCVLTAKGPGSTHDPTDHVVQPKKKKKIACVFWINDGRYQISTILKSDVTVFNEHISDTLEVISFAIISTDFEIVHKGIPKCANISFQISCN